MAGLPRFDPARYPGERPGGPVLVTGEAALPVRLAAAGGASGGGAAAGAATAGERAAPRVVADPPRAPLPRIPGGVLGAGGELSDVRWVVAYGANASPDRLRDKGLTGPGALLIPAVLHGWVAAFEARVTGYGAVPLTLVPQADARTVTWILGVHRDHVDELDRTEGRVASGAPSRIDRRAGSAHHAPPGTYQLGRVGPVQVADGWVLPDGLAYLPGPSTEVLRHDGGWRTWPAHDQTTARRHLAGGGPSAPAPRPPAPVLGPWPVTPLVPEVVWRAGQSGRSIAGCSRVAVPRR
jgi:hypothetical protein